MDEVWFYQLQLIKNIITYNLSVIAEIDGHTVAAVIVNAFSDYDRFLAIEELLDIAQSALKGKSVSNRKLSFAMGGIVCEVLHNSTITLFSQNSELQILPASLAKLIALLVACDYIDDFQQYMIFSQRDMVGGSGNFFSPGDIISFEDAFYAALLPSSNSAVRALSRTIGKRICSK